MSININNIYCSQWLVNEELKKYCEKNNYPSFFISPHHIFHLKDTINYKALVNNNYEIYNKYINDTNQEEHNENIFKNLLSNFDINKMDRINIEYNMDIDKYIVRDGVHRLSIIIFKKIYNENIPLKHFNILFDQKTITTIKEKLVKTTGKVYNNGWHNNTTFGYHSFNIFNININGQRNPKQRLQLIKKHVNFENKVVVDLGCNSGGMLLHLPELKRGFGYDFNKNCIESAKYLNNILKYNNDINFFEKDLNFFNFDTLKNESVDIIFLLALGSWIRNWKELYTNSVKKANIIIYETNNDKEAIPQLKLFRDLGCDLKLISYESTDDITKNYKRKTYLVKCSKK
jgi:hypothetical protein